MNKPILFLLIFLWGGALFLSGCNVAIDTTPTPPAADQTEPITASGTTEENAEPAWAELGLTGRLVFIAYDEDRRRNVYLLDLDTGNLTTVIVPPAVGDALILEVAASPDGSQLLLAYAPPVGEGEIQFGLSDLYLMPSDGSTPPELLVARTDNTETFFNISWPLADTIYYSHFAPNTGDLGETIYKSRVERLQLAGNAPAGAPEVLAVDASWPRLSRDGTRLAYVTTTNDMVVSNADGSDPRIIIPGEVFPAVDAPLFSLDAETLYYSAVESVAEGPSIWDRLLGVRVAEAHNVPSDWFRQPAGIPDQEGEKLTNLLEIGLYGDISTDGEHIAFISTNGVQVMNADGSGVFRLLDISATGTLNWIWE